MIEQTRYLLKGISTLLLVLTFSLSAVQGQDVWTLEKAIDYAQENNLDVQRADYLLQNANLDARQARRNRLPSLSGRTSAGYQFGRTIDPTTNEFKNQQIGFNSYGLDASIQLFSGGRIINSIKKAELDTKAVQLDALATNQRIALSLATTYLQVLLAEETIDNSITSLALSTAQLEQTNRLIRAGSLPENDRLDIEARIAQDEQSLITARNNAALNYLTLKNQLQLDPSVDIKVADPVIEIPTTDLTTLEFEDVYRQALETQYQIKATELRVESAGYDVAIARSGRLPSLSLFGGISTNYSSASKDFTNPDRDNAQIISTPASPVIINGMEATFSAFTEVGVVYPNKSYGSQIKDNFGQNVGISLNVPIYSNDRNRINEDRARIGIQNAKINAQQAKLQLKTDVQRAIADVKASRLSYLAAQRSVEAAEAAYENAKKRFELGVVNNLLLTTARNTFDQAQLRLTQSKYQYLFNLKVIDLYMGKPLQL